MNEKLKKETPIPSRLRGRGVEVSKTLFYCEMDESLLAVRKINDKYIVVGDEKRL